MGLTREKCVVYLDDILVMGRMFEEHLENLKEVFDRLRKAKLTLKPKKCKFLRDKVEYLGHIVSRDGFAADPSKLEAIRRFPTPDHLKTLRSFLGLASYYRRFIPTSPKWHPRYLLSLGQEFRLNGPTSVEKPLNS